MKPQNLIAQTRANGQFDKREVGYTHKSPTPMKCGGCRFFKRGDRPETSRCEIVQGVVLPCGTCQLFCPSGPPTAKVTVVKKEEKTPDIQMMDEEHGCTDGDRQCKACRKRFARMSAGADAIAYYVNSMPTGRMATLRPDQYATEYANGTIAHVHTGLDQENIARITGRYSHAQGGVIQSGNRTWVALPNEKGDAFDVAEIITAESGHHMAQYLQSQMQEPLPFANGVPQPSQPPAQKQAPAPDSPAAQESQERKQGRRFVNRAPGNGAMNGNGAANQNGTQQAPPSPAAGPSQSVTGGAPSGAMNVAMSVAGLVEWAKLGKLTLSSKGQRMSLNDAQTVAKAGESKLGVHESPKGERVGTVARLSNGSWVYSKKSADSSPR